MSRVRTIDVTSLWGGRQHMGRFAPIIQAGMIEVVNINSASRDELRRTLNGIGDVYAQRIIAGRPYRHTEDLVKRKLIPPKAYNRIKDHIIANQQP